MAFLIKVLSGGRRFRGSRDEDLEQLRKEFSSRKAELATALLASADVRSLVEMIFDTSYAETQYFLKAPSKPLLKANKHVVWRILSQLPEGVPLVGLLRDVAQRHGIEAALDIFLELHLVLSELLVNKTVNADLADTLEYGWHIGSPLFGKPSSFASQNRYQRSVSAPVNDIVSRRDELVPRVDESILLLSQEAKTKKQADNVTDIRMRLETPYAASAQVSEFPSDRAGSSRFASRRMSYTGSEPASSLYTTDSDDDTLSTSSRMSLLVAVSEANETGSTIGSVGDVDVESDEHQRAENDNGFTSGGLQLRQSECASTSNRSGFDQQEAHTLSDPVSEKADTSVENSPAGDVKLASSEPGTCRTTTSTAEPKSCTSNGAKDEAESSEANLPAASADSYDSDQQAEEKLPISSSVVLSGRYPESEFYTPEMWTYSANRHGTSFEEGNELIEDTEKVKLEEDMPEDVKVMVVATNMNETYVSVSVQPAVDRNEAGAQADVAEECRRPSSFKTDSASDREILAGRNGNLEAVCDCTEEGTSKQEEAEKEQTGKLTDRKQEQGSRNVEPMQGEQQASDLVVQDSALGVTQGKTDEAVNRVEGPTDEFKQDKEQERSGKEQDASGELMQGKQKTSEDRGRKHKPGDEESSYEVMQTKGERTQEGDSSNMTVGISSLLADSNAEEVANSREENMVDPDERQEPPVEGSQDGNGEQGQAEKATNKDQKKTSVSETEEQKEDADRLQLEENPEAKSADLHGRQEEEKPEVTAEQASEPAGERTSDEEKERSLSCSEEEPGGESPKFDISLDAKDETAAAQSHGRRSFDQVVPHSGLIPLSGPIAYSGSIPYSGNLSLRSDSSTNSTRSFAFPILHADWNSSPVKMAPPDKRFLSRQRHIWRRWCCCFNCANH